MSVTRKGRLTGFRLFNLLAWARLCAALMVLAFFVRVFTSSLTQWTELRTALMSVQFSGIVARGWVLSILLCLFFSALFGRCYCGAVCPLGTVQEAVNRLFGKLIAPSKHAKYIMPSRLRYSVPFAAGISLALGSSSLLILTDPISIFGRGVVGLFGLVTDGITHPAMWVSVAIFTAILAAAARGRRFCDWCPVGTVLGLCSSAALFGMKIDAGLCVSCGNCERACPMNCADSKNKTIDRDRCVLCLSCAAACPLGSVGYSRVTSANVPRRAFFRQIGGLAAYTSGVLYLFSRTLRGALSWAFGGKRDNLSPEKTLDAPLPPGAQDIEHMDTYCIGCNACAVACPAGLLRFSPSHPHLDYSRGYCQYNCVECGHACPADAIHALTIEDKHTTRIALSEFTKAKCVAVTRGESCGACAEVCPTHALRMVPMVGAGSLTVPEFDSLYCIGCGGCLYVCPEGAFTVRGVSPQTRTPGIRRAEQEEETHTFKQGDEFPF